MTWREYDPRECGAQCDRCPLYDPEQPPVRPVTPPSADIAVVVQYPDARDAKRGQPATGPAGRELSSALRAADIDPSRVHLNAAFLCPLPPGRKGKQQRYKDYLTSTRPKWAPGMMEPHMACAPRLDSETAPYRRVVACGSVAIELLTGETQGATKLRGGPLDVDIDGAKVQVMPTLDPRFVSVAPHNRVLFRADMQKAVRFFESRLEWQTVSYVSNPTAPELREFFRRPGDWWSYDVETDSKYPLRASLRCLAITRWYDGEARDAVLIHRHSVEFPGVYYPRDEDWRGVVEALTDAFKDGRLWLGHNAGVYDHLVVETCLGAAPVRLIDSLMMHKESYPQLRHGLAVVGSQLTDATSWKEDKDGQRGHENKSDAGLGRYCVIDTQVPAVAAHKMLPLLRSRGVLDPMPHPDFWRDTLGADASLLDLDHWMQSMARTMHRNGVCVDEDNVRAGQIKLHARLDQITTDLHGLVPGLNPNSSRQMAQLLYKQWGLEIENWTDTGAPSTDDSTLREFQRTPHKFGLDPQQVEIIRLCRLYRRVRTKHLGAYTNPLLRGIVDADGRLRASWNPAGTLVGRFSCSDPLNMQTIPYMFKHYFRAAPGRVLVGSDVSQLHPRIQAQLWGIEAFRVAYQRGKGSYGVTGEMIFGQRFTTDPGHPNQHGVPKKFTGHAKSLRKLAKVYQLAKAYGAVPFTVHSIITKDEDADANLTMTKMTVRQVAAMDHKFLSGMPEFEVAWRSTVEAADKNGVDGRCAPYLVDPLAGRRRDFHKGTQPERDGGERNTVLNDLILKCETAIMHRATMRAFQLLHGDIYEPHGASVNLVLQVHDQLVFECDERDVERVSEALQIALNEPVPGWDVPLYAEVDVGTHLNEA